MPYSSISPDQEFKAFILGIVDIRSYQYANAGRRYGTSSICIHFFMFLSLQTIDRAANFSGNEGVTLPPVSPDEKDS